LFSFEKRLGKGIPIGLKTCRTFSLSMLAPPTGLKVFEFEKNVPEPKPKDLEIGRIRLNSHLKNLQK
jgi:hypothetical protein